MRRIALAAFATLFATQAHAAPITLGAWTFDSALFGNTLAATDGFFEASRSWLNTVNVNPGIPGYLTGANFNTGIANLAANVTYTIGYGAPILNAAGADLAIVSARFSSGDTFTLTIDGTPLAFGPGLAQATGVTRNFFYNSSSSAFPGNLYVTEVDLSAFGLAHGASITSLTIRGAPEADLIRVAGFARETTAVDTPEPASLALLGTGLLALAARRRR